MITLQELKDLLIERYDPLDVLEMLELSTEDIVSAFTERIEDLFPKLQEDIGEEVVQSVDIAFQEENETNQENNYN